MVAWQRGWPHRADGDGGDAPHWFDDTVSSCEGARQISIPFSRVPPSSFEGAACGPYKSGQHSVTELTLALPHSVVQGRDGLTGRVGETVPGYDSQAVSEGRHGVDSSLTRAPALHQNIKCPSRGSGCGSGEPARASSEEESRPRRRPALERDGVSPEGASGPRARWTLTRGGVQPSSETESHPRGAPSPQARRSLCGTTAYPSSEAGFRSRGVGANRFGGPLRLLGPWAPAIGP
jgi:hypothetical protein